MISPAPEVSTGSLDGVVGRRQRFATEAGKFLAVGAVATIVALILFNFLVHGFNTADFAPLNGQPELAYLIANLVGMVISFQGTKGWAFKDRTARHADGGVVAFVAINLVTMLIPISCLYVSRNLLGLDDPISDNISANVVGLLMANIARFFLFRYYVFHERALPFVLSLNDREIRKQLDDRVGQAEPATPAAAVTSDLSEPSDPTPTTAGSTTDPAPRPAP